MNILSCRNTLLVLVFCDLLVCECCSQMLLRWRENIP